MSNKQIKTIFIGTPDFAVPGLKALIKSPDFDIVGVITQPDKPVGRKQVLTPPPVKIEAEKHGIPIYQPENISQIVDRLLQIVPDIIILIAYSQLIPKSILDISKYGAINVHGSLLPKYRGSSCIQYPIMSGDKETGVTIMKMDEGLDTGPIIKRFKTKIEDNDTAGTMFDKLAGLSAKVLPNTLLDYLSGKLEPVPQPSEGMIYAPELKKQDGKIDWSKSAIEIERLIRAMTPWPGASAQVKSGEWKVESIKILGVCHKPLTINQHSKGEIFIENGNLAIQCGDGALEIERLQMEGKKPVSGEEFINGHMDIVGTVLE